MRPGKRIRRSIWRGIGDLFMEHPVIVPLVLVALFVVRNWVFPQLQEKYYDLPEKTRFLYSVAAGFVGLVVIFLIWQFL